MLMCGVLNVVLIAAMSHPVMVNSGVAGVDAVACSLVVVMLIVAHLHTAVHGHRLQCSQMHCWLFAFEGVGVLGGVGRVVVV